MVTIAGGVAGANAAKDIRKAASGSGQKISWVGKDDLRVRFLTEPEGWFKYKEHYSDETKFFPCIGEGCPGCNSASEKVQAVSVRYLANALDVERNQVIALKLPISLANRVVNRYERNRNTLLDRDYTLMRSGTGKNDTEYDVEAEERTNVDLGRYPTFVLEQVLVDAFSETFGIENEPEAEKPLTNADLEPEPEGEKAPF